MNDKSPEAIAEEIVDEHYGDNSVSKKHLKARVAEAIKAAGCGRVFNNLELDDAILEDIGVYGDDRKLFVRGFQLAANLNAIAHVESVMPTREEFVKSFEMACKDPHTPSWWMGFLRGYDSFKIELLRRLGSGT